MQIQESYKTTCSYCGVGCGVLVRKSGPLDFTVQGDPDHPTNRGELCSKGMNLHYSAMDRTDRLLFPMVRRDRFSPLERTTWNSALNKTAAEFKKYIKEFGPDSVGFYVSGQLLTEEYYIINKLIKGFIGTNNIDTNSRLCMSSAVSGYKMAFGEDSVPVSYDDIESADCFLIAGANPAWCHPVVFRRIEAKKKSDASIKVIVIDPRRTETCESADIHLQIHPGTDIYLFHAIARILIEKNWIDLEFIVYHTEGFDEFKDKVFEKSLEEVSEICGVPSQLIYQTAEAISRSKGFLSLWAMGLNQSVVGVNKNLALINLSLITGKIGKPGSGPFSLTGQPNAMGGREVGGLCNLLPAHRELNNPDHRKEVAEFWGVDSIPAEPGFSAVEMFDSLKSGKMKAVWIVCTNPTVSLPDARAVESALRSAEFVVVQDISKDSAAVPFADVVLPAAGWGEKEGTMTSSDRRISYLPKFMDPPGEAMGDAWIIREFAKKMGFESFFSYKNEEEIFLEHCRLTTGTKIDIAGLDYQEIRNLRVAQWPYPSKGYSGSPRLFEDKIFYRPGGKAKIHAVSFEDDSEKPNIEYPLILTTGRIRDQWHSMTRTGKVRKLREHRREPNLEIHPSDALKYGIKEGTIVDVINSRGTVRTKANLTKSIKPGVVFLPMHWGKKSGSDQPRSNNLTSPAFDPQSKQPGFKIAAVKVLPYKKPKEKILIVGGGSATLAFLKHYKAMAPHDEITVICREADPFYNRVLLPDYIGGEKEFEELLPSDQEEILSWNLNMIPNTSVTKIYIEGKKVRDSNDELHSYNKLVLALGSSAIKSSLVPSTMTGIFSLRSKFDADRIRNYFVPGTWALIVGGGLLGLEIASVLVSAGIRVTLVVRTNRLMSKKLDLMGSELLREEIEARGIELIFDAEISKLEGTERISKVKLTNGKVLNPDGIIYAIGTKPNFEIAKESGLVCGNGVVVDAFLRSSDPDIYSIGEMAEHENESYGTVSAVEDQAKIAAQHIFGYSFDEYEGSLHTYLLKVSGLELVSVRLPNTPFEIKAEDKDEFEEITFIDRKKRIYKKCIIRNDRLVAAILIGDTSEFLKFKEWIASHIELGEKRKKLFLGGEFTKPLLGKVVCSCNGVGDGNILEAIYEGEHTLSGIGKRTGAGTGCGSCRSEISNLLKSVIQKV
ncbi:molybdopterin oxidoreductase [Leptospira inadai serovar Lyme str. 10]|uniref:Molybdopterin oxidoreductase n=2 Tax=Leptospira inadai serovar Lyme TaxID=293084 RepID=V6H9W1_9LEPT|nr:nitrate reductase [Leptospira inadai]EQA35832.1 molybdopterin oxidoreductase [Leptospira inadai serovar Lyme str. 10]PNV76751.1 NAD(P)H-nitrite reductase [Leptospira inadai serovar Lyme]